MKLRSLQRVWDDLGRKDPLWAILTADDRRGGRWSQEEFFATGRLAIDGLMVYLENLGLDPPRGRALDFGCGVGRLTRPLAEHFEEVWGVDIAPSMLDLARKLSRHGEKCRFHLNEVDDLGGFAAESFGFVLSLITLQHMRPRYAKRYLREFARLLATGGVLVFQAAGAHQGRGLRRLAPAGLRRLYHRLKHRHAIEMHGLPRAEVERLLQAAGLRVVDVVDETSAGSGWTSYRYCALKPEAEPGR